MSDAPKPDLSLVMGGEAETVPARRRASAVGSVQGAELGAHCAGPNVGVAALDIAPAMRIISDYLTLQHNAPVGRGALYLQKRAGSMSPSSVTYRAALHPDFKTNPFTAAKSLRGAKAENDALLRAVACAWAPPHTAVAWARVFTELTHADERCGAAAAVMVLMLNGISRGERSPSPWIKEGMGMIKNANRKRDFVVRCVAGCRSSIQELSLGSSYVVDSLSVALWALGQAKNIETPQMFMALINELAARCPEPATARVNCALAGAVIGAVVGPRLLPQPEELRARLSRLETETDALLEASCLAGA